MKRVHYPGLRSHPDHHIARQQMRGYGGVVSFEVDGDLWTTARVCCRAHRSGKAGLVESAFLLSGPSDLLRSLSPMELRVLHYSSASPLR